MGIRHWLSSVWANMKHIIKQIKHGKSCILTTAVSDFWKFDTKVGQDRNSKTIGRNINYYKITRVLNNVLLIRCFVNTVRSSWDNNGIRWLFKIVPNNKDYEPYNIQHSENVWVWMFLTGKKLFDSLFLLMRKHD